MRRADAPTLGWISAHVFRHDELGDLLTQAVVPLVADLSGRRQIRGFFYLRYWDGGPHLRVRLLTAPSDVTQVRQDLTERLGTYLQEVPSRNPMTQAAYTAWAAHAASLEDLADYERTLRPPDTVAFGSYLPEHTSFGDGPPLRTVEENFCRSTEIAIRTLGLSPAERLSAATVMTLASAVTSPSSRTAWSDRAGSTGPATADEQEAWHVCRDELTELAARLRAADAPPGSGVPAIEWLGETRRLRDRLTELHSEGVFTAASDRPVAFALQRCLHLHLNRMGITPDQETRLRRFARWAAMPGDRADR